MDTKERLLQFIDSQGISKSEFERKCGLSNGYLNSSKGNFGAKKLDDILRAFPMLNRDWLLTGEGEMLNEIYDNIPRPQDQPEPSGNNVNVGGNASNINNGSNEKTILFALTEVSEMRKLLAEVVYINKEQSQRLLSIVDKLSDKI
jgi:hypothetical protein